MGWIKEKLKSKKLRVTIFSLLTVILQEVFGFDEIMSIKLVAIFSTYVVSQGFADMGKEAVKIEKGIK